MKPVGRPAATAMVLADDAALPTCRSCTYRSRRIARQSTGRIRLMQPPTPMSRLSDPDITQLNSRWKVMKLCPTTTKYTFASLLISTPAIVLLARDSIYAIAS